MQFVLESISEQGIRAGKLIWRNVSNKQLQHVSETPLCLLYTRAGHVPHLTDDVLKELLGSSQSHPTMLTLPTVYETPGPEVLSAFKEGIHKFLNKADHLLYLSIQDPHTPPREGYNEQKSVSVWTKLGRNKVTVADHLRLVETFRPNVFECLCDSASSAGSKLKRIRKSVDRSLKFLDETISERENNETLKSSCVLAAIVGSDVLEERKRSASESAKRPVDGFVLEGFDIEHSRDSLSDVISSTTKLLPEERPRFIHGLASPVDIFSALENGVDVFDSSCVYSATERGCAVVFPIKHKAQRQKLIQQLEKQGEGDRVDDDDGECDTPLPLEIDLNEERYASDFNPLLEGCSCYTCTHHTRAYIHHLLVVKEILAGVLLMNHNLSHFLHFFKNLREAIQSSTYPKFKQSCLLNLKTQQ